MRESLELRCVYPEHSSVATIPHPPTPATVPINNSCNLGLLWATQPRGNWGEFDGRSGGVAEIMVIESHLSTLLYCTLHYITLQVTGLVGRADLLAAIFMLLAFRAGDRSDSSNYLHFLSLPYFFECQRKIV